MDYEEGTDQEVTLHDGSRITLHKLGHNYDPTSRMQAVTALHAAVAEHKFLTGLIYLNEERAEFIEDLNLCDTPLAFLDQEAVQPLPDTLDQINAEAHEIARRRHPRPKPAKRCSRGGFHAARVFSPRRTEKPDT